MTLFSERQTLRAINQGFQELSENALRRRIDVDGQPFDGIEERLRSRKELDPDKIFWRFGAGRAAQMSYACVDGHRLAGDCEADRLDRFERNAEWRLDQGAVPTDVYNACGGRHFQRSPQDTDDFKSDTGTAISEWPHWFPFTRTRAWRLRARR